MTANRQIILATVPTGKLLPEHFRQTEGAMTGFSGAQPL